MACKQARLTHTAIQIISINTWTKLEWDAKKMKNANENVGKKNKNSGLCLSFAYVSNKETIRFVSYL